MAKPEKKPFKTNADKVREKFKTMGSDDRWFKPKPGKHIIRILPTWKENGEFFLEGQLHHGFKIGGRDRAMPCPMGSNRGKCPVCLIYPKLEASHDDDHKELAKRIRSKKKYWVNLIDRNQADRVLMYGMSEKAIGPAMEAFDDDDLGDITDPDEGHDCRFTRTGTTQFDTRYALTVRPKPSPIGVDDWLDKLHNLDEEVLEWMTFKEMVKIIKANYGEVLAELGIKFAGSTDDDDEKKEEKPKKKPAPKKVEEPDDDDDEDEKKEDKDDDDDDEDDEDDDDK